MTLARASIPVLVSLLVLVACGPEQGFVPRSGLYRYEVSTLENTCGARFEDAAAGEAEIEVDDDTITAPMSEVLSFEEPTCEGCVPLTAMKQWITRRDPGAGLYVAAGERAPGSGGCVQEGVELEVLDARTLQAVITSEVVRDGACPWKEAATADCVVTREYTYTRVED